MSGEEINAFELRLQNDPELKSEFQFQSETIEAIKAYRKAELKTRLDNLNVGSSGFSIPGVKLAMVAAVSISVGLGIYYYTADDTTEAAQQEEVIAEENTNNAEEISSEAGENIPTSEEENAVAAENEEMISESGSVEAEENLIENEPAAEFTDPTGGVDEATDVSEIEEVEAVETPINETVADLEIESKEDTKHTFHYKFYNSKLYLYGDFKNVPYEIIEYNTPSGKSLYLFYNSQYYYLEANQMEVSPLQEVKEEKLIEELESLRTGN